MVAETLEISEAGWSMNVVRRAAAPIRAGSTGAVHGARQIASVAR